MISTAKCKLPRIYSSHKDVRRATGDFSQELIAETCVEESMRLATQMKVIPQIEPCNLTDESESELHSKIKRILSACPTLHKTYWVPFFFHNPHLQLIPYMLRNYMQKTWFPPFKYVSQRFSLEDGEELVLDWAGTKNVVPSAEDVNAKEPCTVLIMHHGAYGRSNDMPGFSYVLEALKRNWLVLAVNRRGHLGKIKQPKFNFFGNTSDVRYIVESCVRRARPKAKVVMIGISAGSGLVARYMGEQGLAIKQLRQRGKGCFESEEAMADHIYGYVSSVVGIAPGYNIEKCMSRFGPPYSDILLTLGKSFCFKKNAEVLQRATGNTEVDAALKKCYETSLLTNDLQVWLDNAYAFGNNSFIGDDLATGVFHIDRNPLRNGKVVPGARCAGIYSSSDEYYDYHNPIRVIQHIIQPCLFLNAEDDPLCVVQNVYESLYLLSKNAIGAVCVTTKTGSHCSFLTGKPWNMDSWSEEVAGEFFQAVLAA